MRAMFKLDSPTNSSVVANQVTREACSQGFSRGLPFQASANRIG